MNLARDDTGLGESDSDESNEKWSKSGCIFKRKTMRFPSGLNVIYK